MPAARARSCARHGRLIGLALRDPRVRIIRRWRPLPAPGSQRPALQAPADGACRPRLRWGWEEGRGAGVGRALGVPLRPPPRALQATEAPPASKSRVPLRTAPGGGGEARPSEGCVRGEWNGFVPRAASGEVEISEKGKTREGRHFLKGLGRGTGSSLSAEPFLA